MTCCQPAGRSFSSAPFVPASSSSLKTLFLRSLHLSYSEYMFLVSVSRVLAYVCAMRVSGLFALNPPRTHNHSVIRNRSRTTQRSSRSSKATQSKAKRRSKMALTSSLKVLGLAGFLAANVVFAATASGHIAAGKRAIDETWI